MNENERIHSEKDVQISIYTLRLRDAYLKTNCMIKTKIRICHLP